MRHLAPVLLLAACSPAARPVDLMELQRHHQRYSGQRVELRGWLRRACSAYDCGLHPQRVAGEDFVSIGESRLFDAMVARAVGHEVIIRATVSDECWDGCFDRADQLVDPKLVRILQ